jgi:hypothetical protein
MLPSSRVLRSAQRGGQSCNVYSSVFFTFLNATTVFLKRPIQFNPDLPPADGVFPTAAITTFHPTLGTIKNWLLGHFPLGQMAKFSQLVKQTKNNLWR